MNSVLIQPHCHHDDFALTTLCDVVHYNIPGEGENGAETSMIRKKPPQ